MKVTVTKENESIIYGGNIYKHGQSFDVEDSIGKALVERGCVAVTAADGAGAEIDLDSLSYPELKKLAAERGLAATGKKEELIARLLAAEKSEDEDESADDSETEDEDESAGDLPNTGMPE